MVGEEFTGSVAEIKKGQILWEKIQTKKKLPEVTNDKTGRWSKLTQPTAWYRSSVSLPVHCNIKGAAELVTNKEKNWYFVYVLRAGTAQSV
jgi:hypothetical protein